MRELIIYLNDNTDLSNRQILEFVKGFSHLDEPEHELTEDIALLNSLGNTKPDLEGAEVALQLGKVMSVLI